MSDVDTTKMAAAVKTPVDGLNSTPMDFFQQVWSAEWKNLDNEAMAAFAQRFHEFIQGANTLREKWDAVVWAGHTDGSVPESIKYIRAPRTGDAGGPKAKVKTAAELLLKK